MEKKVSKSIHYGSNAVKYAGIALLVLAIMAVIAGVITWASAADNYDSVAFPVSLFISGLVEAALAVFVLYSSIVIRASETYLYEKDDHPQGTREEIAGILKHQEEAEKMRMEEYLAQRKLPEDNAGTGLGHTGN